MRAKIQTRFATAKATASVLGVPRARAKKLAKLVDLLSPVKDFVHVHSKSPSALNGGLSKTTFHGFQQGHLRTVASSTLKRKTSKKTRASRKRQARAGFSKASR